MCVHKDLPDTHRHSLSGSRATSAICTMSDWRSTTLWERGTGRQHQALYTRSQFFSTAWTTTFSGALMPV